MSVNVNKKIWDVYFNKLLPLFVSSGDDGNYASTAARDLECLQVRISRNCSLSYLCDTKAVTLKYVVIPFRSYLEEYITENLWLKSNSEMNGSIMNLQFVLGHFHFIAIMPPMMHI